MDFILGKFVFRCTYPAVPKKSWKYGTWISLSGVNHQETTKNKKNESHKQRISFLTGFQYNLSFGDVLWNPLAVKAEFESRFGFDGPHVEKLLSYTAQLTEVNQLKNLMFFSLLFFLFVPWTDFPALQNALCLALWSSYKIINILTSFSSNKCI